jgi:hypothetical protein
VPDAVRRGETAEMPFLPNCLIKEMGLERSYKYRKMLRGIYDVEKEKL